MYTMPIASLELYARKHSERLLGCAECRLFGGENLGADCLDEQARLLYLMLQQERGAKWWLYRDKGSMSL
jgi:hypothetical protein